MDCNDSNGKKMSQYIYIQHAKFSGTRHNTTPLSGSAII